MANMASTKSPVSFQPWAKEDKEESDLKSILSRVNNERGHFRSITEDSLRDEIIAEETGGGALSSSEDEEDEEDGEARIQPTTREELYKAKAEMLEHVASAHQEAMMALDFVSLLLSKDAPRQAEQTISPLLKQRIPKGTLGTDLWERMQPNRAQQSQNELLARGLRMESLQSSADSLLSAAKRLESNVKKETIYWGQVLSVKEAGWSVCRIPGQAHKLGVRYGFSEATGEFARRGLAALNTDSEGNIVLEHGVGMKPKSLRLRLQKGDQLLGSTVVPRLPEGSETTLEARIRFARDSLFDEELYHEMVRESRILASMGVTMYGSTISLPVMSSDEMWSQRSAELLLDLVSLDEQRSEHDEDRDHDNLAQAMLLAARLLLTQAHRDRLKLRSQVPPPLSDAKKETPTLAVLRPLLTFLLHRSTIDNLNAYLKGLQIVLEAASVATEIDLASVDMVAPEYVTSAEGLIQYAQQPLNSSASLKVIPPGSEAATFRFHIHTVASAPSFGSDIVFVKSERERFRLHQMDAIAECVDATVASVLAAAAGHTAKDWVVDEREASLSTEAGVGKETEQVWINLSSSNGRLSLSSMTKKSTWAVEGISEASSFWDAAKDLLD